MLHAANDAKVLCHLRERSAIRCNCTVIVHAQKQILFRLRADFGEKHAGEIRSAIHLLRRETSAAERVNPSVLASSIAAMRKRSMSPG